MLDSIYVPSMVHVTVGTLVLVSCALALVATVRAAWTKRPLSGITQGLFILFQVVLMVQIVVGIKLLDQGLGPLQLFIHYLGGLAPMGFILLYYWLPVANGVSQSRRAAIVTALSFSFVVLTFTVGSMYVAGLG